MKIKRIRYLHNDHLRLIPFLFSFLHKKCFLFALFLYFYFILHILSSSKSQRTYVLISNETEIF